MALWQEGAAIYRHETILEIARSMRRGAARGGISITLKHRVCLLGWFSVAAGMGKGGGSWTRKEWFQRDRERRLLPPGEKGGGERASCVSLSLSPWISFVISYSLFELRAVGIYFTDVTVCSRFLSSLFSYRFISLSLSLFSSS